MSRNYADADCSKCGNFFQWLIGTPLVCPDCRKKQDKEKRIEPILISDVVEALSGFLDLKGGELEPPMQQKVNSPDLAPYVRQTLETLGHPEAFVTDETMVGDFVEYSIRGRGGQKLIKRLSQNLGIQVQIEDFLVDVAKKLRMKKENQRE